MPLHKSGKLVSLLCGLLTFQIKLQTHLYNLKLTFTPTSSCLIEDKTVHTMFSYAQTIKPDQWLISSKKLKDLNNSTASYKPMSYSTTESSIKLLTQINRINAQPMLIFIHSTLYIMFC